MGKMKRALTVLLSATALLMLAYFVLKMGASWQQGYSWQEMDWREQGSTSIADFLMASDIGKRNVAVNGKSCVEYFAYKDGLPIKTVCPK